MNEDFRKLLVNENRKMKWLFMDETNNIKIFHERLIELTKNFKSKSNLIKLQIEA